ncbi:MAG: hypothetical protein ACJ763_03965, partial [Bdellovibrionia bacterium]
MNTIDRKKLLKTLVLALAPSLAQAETYCVPVATVDFNNYRKIVDGKELAYLLFLKPYISTDPNDPGLLEAYSFSPDGRTFTARVNSSARWPDGTPLTSKEAAAGIAKGLTYRTLGQRVSVKSVRIKDERTFELVFDSSIENTTGVLREALSTNSRHNRLWPIRLSSTGPVKPVAVIGRFPIRSKDGAYEIEYKNHSVKISNASGCSNADFSIFPGHVAGQNRRLSLSPAPSEITLLLNSTRLDENQRKELSKILRAAVDHAAPETGIRPTISFFEPGETGHQQKLKWPKGTSLSSLAKTPLKIGYEIPIFKDVLGPVLKTLGLNAEFVSLPSEQALDAELLASGIQNGRHVILQDILEWPNVSHFLAQAPLTHSALKNVASHSSSTLPPDEASLRSFENAALQEMAFVPIARKHPVAESKATSDICLTWTSKGELTFSDAKNCDAAK